jgi:DNA (cytosine-5)-methyltransferase 1
MSVANHKKRDELPRNSLVIRSIVAVAALQPQIFVFENVRSFLTSICLDVNGEYKTIKEAILSNLGATYNIDFRVENLKDFGSPSSRTRTIVIGSRIQNTSVTPADFFPKRVDAPNLRDLIGHLPTLKTMGEISPSDIYHGFRTYDLRMKPWVDATEYGRSAFENETPELKPHRIVDGKLLPNQEKNGDKYKRQLWERVAPCVHTRNDILASQNTVHPVDSRVFSIRELMLMMGVPDHFRWSNIDGLNSLSLEQKQRYLKENEINIRQCLGEGVPTPVFQSIGTRYAKLKKNNFVNESWKLSLTEELSNTKRKELSAYYSSPAAVWALIKSVPRLRSRNIRILEPACGNGALIEQLISNFSVLHEHVDITLMDIDERAIAQVANKISTMSLPPNVTITMKAADFLREQFNEKFDLVIGNPPYGKFGGKENLFISFMKKAREISTLQALIIPKAFLNANEYSMVRHELSHELKAIVDLGERCFADVLIETICLVLSKKADGKMILNSWPTGKYVERNVEYVTDSIFPSWLPYRNSTFDRTIDHLEFDKFDFYRDRSLRKSDRLKTGDLTLVRSKNLSRDGQIFGPFEFVNRDRISAGQMLFISQGITYIVPNLTYYPRCSALPENMYTDGSCALLKLKTSSEILNPRQLSFFASREFFDFYRVAMNYSTRSLNVDRVSVFYWGVLKNGSELVPTLSNAGPSDILTWFP